MPVTPDQAAAEIIARSIEGRILRLNEERKSVLPAAAAAKLAEIDAEIAALTPELARVQGRRPPKVDPPRLDTGPVRGPQL